MNTVARLSIEQYDRMIEDGAFEGDGLVRPRIELIRGHLRDMEPTSIKHEWTVDVLTEWSILEKHTDRVRVRNQHSLGLPSCHSVPEPDLAWVIEKSYRHARPTVEDALLVIEVADSSLEYDRGEKAELYAAAGIADYWIANVVDEVVEVLREPAGGKYRSVQVYGAGKSVQPLRFPEINLSVDALFGRDGE